MSTETNTLGYWLNWRFLLCAIFVLAAIIGAILVILKYEDFFKKKSKRRDNQQEKAECLYSNASWKTCLKVIHPGWLLAYRLFAFTLLLSLLTADAVVHSAGVFYFYTQWTFSLVTIYFGLGTVLSIYGICQHKKDIVDTRADSVERGTYMALTPGENPNPHDIPVNTPVESRANKNAGIWGYVFQILFQVCAGAVILTDTVYWFIIYPFLTADTYKLDFLVVSMHTVNAVFFFGEMCLNSLQFPFFGLAYFALWTSIYVIFQWIVHAFISMWWPYPFLALSSPFAPLWYLGVGLLCLPCYGIVYLIFRMKKVCLSRFSKNLTGS
jgi:hypothetical protein